MVKRFTCTDKWEDTWFSELDASMKLAWMYILDRCDHAGIWRRNFKNLRFHCHSEKTDMEITEIFKDRIVEIDNDKWFIPNFLKFQYPSGLNSNKPAIVGVRKRLIEAKLLKTVKRLLSNDYLTISNDNTIIKDKDKDIDKEQDKGKDKVIKDVFSFWNTLEIVKHRELDKYKSFISARLENYTVEEIKEAMQNYKQILCSHLHYWTHKWGIDEFLSRKGGLDKFLTVNKPFENFLNNNGIKKPPETMQKSTHNENPMSRKKRQVDTKEVKAITDEMNKNIRDKPEGWILANKKLQKKADDMRENINSKSLSEVLKE